MFGHDDKEEDHSKGKLAVLEELRQMALDSMGSKLGDKLGGGDKMKQISVMAPDQEGLQKGLEMAKDVAGKSDSKFAGGDSDSDMVGADDGDFDDMSPEEIDDLIKQLQSKKQEKLNC